jgi:Probable transposase.
MDKIHEKVTNKCKDFLQKLTTDLVKNYEVSCLENLGTKTMMKSHKLARSISEQGRTQFVSLLK